MTLVVSYPPQYWMYTHLLHFIRAVNVAGPHTSTDQGTSNEEGPEKVCFVSDTRFQLQTDSPHFRRLGRIF